MGGFFDDLEAWKKEWKGMPSFIQKDQTPAKSIIVHFEKEEDFKKFSKLIDQTITEKTQSIWFPKAKIKRLVNKQYIDKSES